MNKIFKQLTSIKYKKEVRHKRTSPVTLCIDDKGYCLGKVDGNDIEKAFTDFPNASVLNIIPVRGKTKVIFKNS